MKLRFFVFLSVIYFDISALGMWECIFFSVSVSLRLNVDRTNTGTETVPWLVLKTNPTNKRNKVIILNLKKTPTVTRKFIESCQLRLPDVSLRLCRKNFVNLDLLWN